MKKTIYVIRHGQTEWNKSELCMGQQDIALNATGEAQAQAVARHFAGVPLDAIYTSDLQRTQQTAAPLAREKGLEVKVDARLREIHYGILEGSKPTEWEDRFPEVMATWEYGSVHQAPPGGETRGELMDRCAAVLEEIAATEGESIAVVTHGGVVMALLTWLIFDSIDQPAEHSLGIFKVYNASVTTLSWNGKRWRIVGVNQGLDA